MTNTPDAEDENYFSPVQVREWMHQEIADIMQASGLRLKELTDFVSAYSAGEITPLELRRRQIAYIRRWREALPGPDVPGGHSR